jgi:hypothetical protein
MSDPVAKRDLAALHIALGRRALGIPADIPELDGPIPLFDSDSDSDTATPTNRKATE